MAHRQVPRPGLAQGQRLWVILLKNSYDVSLCGWRGGPDRGAGARGCGRGRWGAGGMLRGREGAEMRVRLAGTPFKRSSASVFQQPLSLCKSLFFQKIKEGWRQVQYLAVVAANLALNVTSAFLFPDAKCFFPGLGWAGRYECRASSPAS